MELLLSSISRNTKPQRGDDFFFRRLSGTEQQSDVMMHGMVNKLRVGGGDLKRTRDDLREAIKKCKFNQRVSQAGDLAKGKSTTVRRRSRDRTLKWACPPGGVLTCIPRH